MNLRHVLCCCVILNLKIVIIKYKYLMTPFLKAKRYIFPFSFVTALYIFPLRSTDLQICSRDKIYNKYKQSIKEYVSNK